MIPVGFTIVTPPRTKKNHGEATEIGRRCAVCRRGERTIMQPSKQYQEFELRTTRALQVAYATREPARIPCDLCDERGRMESGRYRGKLCIRCGGSRVVALPITAPVLVELKLYRERATGDLVGYQQAIADVLEMAGVVKNDALIVGWPIPADGLPLRKDAARPRLELRITAAPAAQAEMGLE